MIYNSFAYKEGLVKSLQSYSRHMRNKESPSVINPPVTLPEDGRVLQSTQQPEAMLARAVCFIESWVSGAYLNPTQNELERERERSALSFKANRPLLYSSVGSWSGQTPLWCFQNSTESSWRTLSARAARLLNVSKHSPSILANLLRLSDGSSRPSWPHIAVSLIRNSLHIRRTSSYSRFSHAASRGQLFFLAHYLIRALRRKRCSYTRNRPTIAQTGTPTVPESQVFPLTHNHRSPFHPFGSPEDWFELQIDAWKWLQADVIILRNGNDSSREKQSGKQTGGKVSSD